MYPEGGCAGLRPAGQSPAAEMDASRRREDLCGQAAGPAYDEAGGNQSAARRSGASGQDGGAIKGGDPTIFGRVGEEAELLRRNGISYEIVPGITSAISVPAYAGIPVTHRDYASSVSIITGHESPDKLDHSIHWDKVTNATGTLVFLMGVAKIGYISGNLIKHGRSPETPVALVRWGRARSRRR